MDVTKNDDFVVNLYNSDYLDNQSILDYSTKRNELGYLIKDNIDMIIHIANRDIISNACTIEFYYYDVLNNRNIKIRSKDSYYVFDSVINAIPEHTYTYLKNIDRLYGKVFVVKINYEKKINNIAEKSTNSNSISEAEDIEHTNKCFYFKLVRDSEYMAYKKIKDDADSFTIKKKGPVDIKNK